MQFVVRFLVGGAIVSLFAAIGSGIRPKSFAGLFGAAPSVALATLAIAIHSEGTQFAALEARSMILGALAFFVYACFCVVAMGRWKVRAPIATISGLAIWIMCAVGAWYLIWR